MALTASDLTLARDGAQHFKSVLDRPTLAALIDTLSSLPADVAGVRIAGEDTCAVRPFLKTAGPIGAVAAVLMSGAAKPVRTVLFDKSAGNNWSLAWHQDRTVVVRRRIDTPGYGSWSRKAGLQHVEPPWSVLERLVTLRVHLDDVEEDNAPLLILPGSHKLGRLSEADVLALATSAEPVACPAAAGDVWAYATLVVHASQAAASPSRRRVLQVDYATHELDGDLDWLGV